MIPQDRKPMYDNIPAELKAWAQWVGWRLESRAPDRKPAKIPYSPRTLQNASAIDPSTWGSYGDAVGTHAAFTGASAGIGFVFTDRDPFAGVDLDDCIDEAGRIAPEAWQIIAALDSYSEVSPSRRGVKIFVRGVRADGFGCRSKDVTGFGEIEVYDRGRFFTVTGVHLLGTPREVRARGDILADLCRRYLPQRPEVSAVAPFVGASPAAELTMADRVALIRAERSANGDKFRRLFRDGDLSDFGGDHSAADLALAAMLLFHCNGDPERADRIFRHSRLYRSKWDERRGSSTYGAMTITRAMQSPANEAERRPS